MAMLIHFVPLCARFCGVFITGLFFPQMKYRQRLFATFNSGVLRVKAV